MLAASSLPYAAEALWAGHPEGGFRDHGDCALAARAFLLRAAHVGNPAPLSSVESTPRLSSPSWLSKGRIIQRVGVLYYVA